MEANYFTILYWFCHTSTWIHHGCTRIPHPKPPSHLNPHTIPLGHPSAPAPSILYPASNLDWQFLSYMILYMFQCHSPKSSHPLLFPQSPKDCSIHLCLFLLSRIQGYHYHLSKHFFKKKRNKEEILFFKKEYSPFCFGTLPTFPLPSYITEYFLKWVSFICWVYSSIIKVNLINYINQSYTNMGGGRTVFKYVKDRSMLGLLQHFFFFFCHTNLPVGS